MLQLGGVWCDVIGVCYLLGPCRSSSQPPTVSSRKYFPHFPSKEPGHCFFTRSLCDSHQKYSCRFFINVLVEALIMRIVISDRSSVLCSLGEPCWQYWLCWWPYDQMIIQGAVQYSVQCTISYSRKPGIVLKAVTCPGLSHVSMPRSRACTSKSGGDLLSCFFHS